MARAQGARAQMALAFETTYGTPPTGGFTKMPFASTTLGAEQPLLNSELLGYGRDPLAPIKDAVTADGDVVVPLDAEAFGFWLKAAFGAPTTTGTGPWTHEFQSGAWTLPSLSIETGMPEVPRYAMYSGCVLDQITWQMQRSGLLTATARLVAQGETVGTTTSAGTPAALELKRFGHFNGSITRNGSALRHEPGELWSRQLLAEHDGPVRRGAVHLEHVLCEIDADDGNLSHGCPLLQLVIQHRKLGTLRCRLGRAASTPSPV